MLLLLQTWTLVWSSQIVCEHSKMLFFLHYFQLLAFHVFSYPYNLAFIYTKFHLIPLTNLTIYVDLFVTPHNPINWVCTFPNKKWCCLQISTPHDATIHIVNNNKNKIGPRTDPCGTPLDTSIQDDSAPLMQTRCFLYPSANFQSSYWLNLVYHELLFINLVWGTLSKTFAKSRKITSTSIPLSTQSVTLFRNANKLLKHDRPLITMLWLTGSSKDAQMASHNIDSYILGKCDWSS